MRIRAKRPLLRAALALGFCGFSPAAFAQESSDEIVVTARKRDEALISVPVSVVALGAQQLQDLGVSDFADLTTAVPGLSVAQLSDASGGSIFMRGVGSTALGNPGINQTVSINLDGVQVGRGQALRLGQMDMSRVEVLRGPQALFFGKNSPAGVISITTQDPGDELEAMLRGGYEFNGEEAMMDFVASAPFGDTFRVRLAGNYTSLQGWMHNQAADVAAAANAIVPGAVSISGVDTGPRYDSYAARLSAVWEPNNRFSLRGKFNLSGLDGVGFQRGQNQKIACRGAPGGTPQYGPHIAGLTTDPALQAQLAAVLATADDCTANDTFSQGDINPAHIGLNPPPEGGTDPRGEHHTDFALTSLEANWSITPSLMLTSVTGYLEIDEARYDTYSYAPVSGSPFLNFGGPSTYSQLSEEVRLTSDFADSPLNFLLGVYAEETELTAVTRRYSIALGPLWDQKLEGSTLSVFGQLMYDITPTLELAGGVRWSREARDLAMARDGVQQPLNPASLEFDNTSPEITLTWRPSGDFTLYGSYREGFKAGSFSLAQTAGPAFAPPGADLSYAPETVEGWEVGTHANLLGGQLRLNAAYYDYDYSDLQVNSIRTITDIPVIFILNAASASVSGVEFDFDWRPSAIDGLSIHGAANYSDNTYANFPASPCYTGQTVAEGCNRIPNATGAFTAQDLSGRRMPSAPEWTGSIGASYRGAFEGAGLGYFVGLDGTYRSEWNNHAELQPETMQDAVWYLNGVARLYAEDDGWEIGLVGRNLTEEFRAYAPTGAPLTGSGTGTPAGVHADFSGYVNRGREILLQITLRPTSWGR